MAYNYKAPYSSGTTTAETAQSTGLGTASNILASDVSKTQSYPSDISGSLQGPATANYTQNIGYTPINTVSGLTGGDYEKLQTNLQSPIINQGNLAQQGIKDTYGAQGLYGSVGGGLMSGAQAQSQLSTQDALSNAVAQRYALQLQDQEQQIGQNTNLFQANAATADQQNAYNQAQLGWNVAQEQAGVDFRNAQAEAANQYIGDKQTWQNNIDQTNFTNALNLAGLGTTGTSANQSYTTAQNAADAAQQAALYGGIGQLAGGLMGSYDTSGNTGWNFSDVGNTVSGWFS